MQPRFGNRGRGRYFRPRGSGFGGQPNFGMYDPYSLSPEEVLQWLDMQHPMVISRIAYHVEWLMHQHGMYQEPEDPFFSAQAEPYVADRQTTRPRGSQARTRIANVAPNSASSTPVTTSNESSNNATSTPTASVSPTRATTATSTPNSTSTSSATSSPSVAFVTAGTDVTMSNTTNRGTRGALRGRGASRCGSRRPGIGWVPQRGQHQHAWTASSPPVPPPKQLVPPSSDVYKEANQDRDKLRLLRSNLELMNKELARISRSVGINVLDKDNLEQYSQQQRNKLMPGLQCARNAEKTLNDYENYLKNDKYKLWNEQQEQQQQQLQQQQMQDQQSRNNDEESASKRMKREGDESEKNPP